MRRGRYPAAVTTEGMAVEPADESDALRCYRHPDRETWVRCGRCDRPICPRCAMQGPVGFRCRDCGRPVHDPLTSFTPVQLVGGFLLSATAGTIAGLLSGRIGFFVILVAWFAGAFIADLVTRFVGYKHGPVMAIVLIGGILAGAAVAFAIDAAVLVSSLGGPEAGGALVGQFLLQQGLWALLAAAITAAGAWSRLR
jgi:hypothetical protein